MLINILKTCKKFIAINHLRQGLNLEPLRLFGVSVSSSRKFSIEKYIWTLFLLFVLFTCLFLYLLLYIHVNLKNDVLSSLFRYCDNFAITLLRASVAELKRRLSQIREVQILTEVIFVAINSL